MAPHIVAVLKLGLSVVLDFPANGPVQRRWMRELIDASGAPHELHLLDMPDALCLERLHRRNASGEHPFHVTDEEFAQFTRYFVPPLPEEGFNVVVHTA
jgi:predicted kinase